MRDRLIAVKRKVLGYDRLIFVIISLVFFLICSNAVLFGDDTNANGMRVEGGTFLQYWQKSLELYGTWSSRLFVNFFVFVFTDHGTFWWGIFMGLSLYVLMYSFSALFVERPNRESNVLIAGMVMLFPFMILNSAGWIATATTFLCPAAFGFLSLIPIKRVSRQQRIRWWEYIFYGIALLYGANNEQMMVVVLGSYLVAVVYFLAAKKLHPIVILQTLLSVVSFLIVALCPGNAARSDAAHIICFPNWGMFNLIDKVDLGYSTTMQWLFFGSNLFMIAGCLLFAVLLHRRYGNERLTFLSALPFMMTVLFGPLKTITTEIFPRSVFLTKDVDRQGLVTVNNRGDWMMFGKYFIWAALLIILCVTLLLLQNDLKQLLVTFTLVGTGLASRVAIGFSPTVHSSLERTFSILVFCIIAVMCYAYDHSLESGQVDQRMQSKMKWISYGVILLSLTELYFGMVK